MDNDETTKQIEERLAQLPEDIQNAILSSDFDQKMQAIGRAHNLHIDQAQQLGSETLLVMLGVSPITGFPDEVVRQVHVTREEADKIIADINTQILAPIRESMRRTYEEAASMPAPAPKNPPAMQKSVIMPSAAAAPKPGASQAPLAAPAIPPKAPSMTISAAPAPVLPQSTPPAMPVATAPSMPIVPKAPAAIADLHPAEVMLNEKTVQVPAPMKPSSDATPSSNDEPPKPGAYKADPYREPIE